MSLRPSEKVWALLESAQMATGLPASTLVEACVERALLAVVQEEANRQNEAFRQWQETYKKAHATEVLP